MLYNQNQKKSVIYKKRIEMSKNLWLVIIFLIIQSCSDDDQPFDQIITKNGVDYFQSYENWLQFKEERGNSYYYHITFQSWTGNGNITEVRVKDDQVISRWYREVFVHASTGDRDTTDIYFEDSSRLNSNPEGAPPLTIDELYTECVEQYLEVDPKHNEIYFDTNQQGLMASCGFVPKACVDDCFQGIRLTAIAWE